MASFLRLPLAHFVPPRNRVGSGNYEGAGLAKSLVHNGMSGSPSTCFNSVSKRQQTLGNGLRSPNTIIIIHEGIETHPVSKGTNNHRALALVNHLAGCRSPCAVCREIPQPLLVQPLGIQTFDGVGT